MLDLSPATAISRMEEAVHQEVGRNIDALFSSAVGNLLRSALSIANTSKPHIGILTGFFIPGGTPPAAETDGPVGAVLLAAALKKLGIPCRIITDKPCEGACAAALRGAGVDVPLDVVQDASEVGAYTKEWQRLGITHAVSIERCGRSADGTPRNMRGVDIGPHTVLLDDLFQGGSWEKIAVGDGGNEIGMGSIPAGVIANNVAHGDTIACVTPADHLVVAGVSNWGAYALLGALGAIRKDWKKNILYMFDIGLHEKIMETMVHEGPAVDGVTRAQDMSVDGLPLARHQEKLLEVARLLEDNLRNQITAIVPLTGPGGYFQPLSFKEFLVAGGLNEPPQEGTQYNAWEGDYTKYLKSVGVANRTILFDKYLANRGMRLPKGFDDLDDAHVDLWLELFPLEKPPSMTPRHKATSDYFEAIQARNNHIEKLDWAIRRLQTFYEPGTGDPHDPAPAHGAVGLAVDDVANAARATPRPQIALPPEETRFTGNSSRRFSFEGGPL